MRQFVRILVVLDASAPEQAALEYAAALAKGHGATLKLVDIVPEHMWPVRRLAPDYEHIRELYAKEKQEFLEAAAAKLREQGLSVTCKVLYGRSSLEITREVLRDQHDLVIKDAKGQRSRRTGFFGTTALRLLRQCPCDVLLSKPGAAGWPQRVLAAIDASPGDEANAALNRKILDAAQAVAGQKDRLHVAHAWHIHGENLLRSRMAPDEYARIEQGVLADNERCFAQQLAEYDLRLTDANVHLLHGDPSQAIPELVQRQGIDLLVIGTVARTGIAGLFIGNTAEALLDRVECSLLAVKPEGFMSPVLLETE